MIPKARQAADAYGLSRPWVPREPLHIHVEAGDREAKFWLRPEVRVAYNDGFDGKTLRELLRLVEANRERIETAWRNFFG